MHLCSISGCQANLAWGSFHTIIPERGSLIDAGAVRTITQTLGLKKERTELRKKVKSFLKESLDPHWSGLKQWGKQKFEPLHLVGLLTCAFNLLP